MGFKAMLFVGLFLATIFIISSEVAARELAENSNTIDTTTKAAKIDGLKEAKYPGGGYGGYPSGVNGNVGYPSIPYGGGYCRYGCCGRSYYGVGCRCCNYASEAVNAAKP